MQAEPLWIQLYYVIRPYHYPKYQAPRHVTVCIIVEGGRNINNNVRCDCNRNSASLQGGRPNASVRRLPVCARALQGDALASHSPGALEVLPPARGGSDGRGNAGGSVRRRRRRRRHRV